MPLLFYKENVLIKQIPTAKFTFEKNDIFVGIFNKSLTAYDY